MSIMYYHSRVVIFYQISHTQRAKISRAFGKFNISISSNFFNLRINSTMFSILLWHPTILFVTRVGAGTSDPETPRAFGS